MKKSFLFIGILGLISFCSCNYFSTTKAVERDTSITKSIAFNPIFIDSLALEQFLFNETDSAEWIENFRDFYKNRNYQFAWFDSSGLSEQGQHFMNLQANYIGSFGDSTLYNPTLISSLEKLANDKTLNAEKKDALVSRAELLLTKQFFTYAIKQFKGANLDATKLGWYIPKKKINLNAVLDASLKSQSDSLDLYTPLNPQFKKLESYLALYLKIQKYFPKDSLPKKSSSLELGDSASYLPLLKTKLYLLGDLPLIDSSIVFNKAVRDAIIQFQLRMGLPPKGKIDKAFLSALQIPIEKRIEQIMVNLERMRWMPPNTNQPSIVVNIPAFEMHVFDSGRRQFSMKVIVGTTLNNTVIFSGKLQYIVFSPYWHVPPSIIRKEMLPAIQRNPNYLAEHHMEITGYSNQLPIIRQRPGKANALGGVKFLFPNNYNIYFHDTPIQALFDEDNRSFSHGCIRISEPKKMAAYLLKNDSHWTDQKIDSCMQLSKEKWVTLSQPIPVFISYFTAWVNQEGKLQFRKDLYGHDKKMVSKLFVK